MWQSARPLAHYRTCGLSSSSVCSLVCLLYTERRSPLFAKQLPSLKAVESDKGQHQNMQFLVLTARRRNGRTGREFGSLDAKLLYFQSHQNLHHRYTYQEVTMSITARLTEFHSSFPQTLKAIVHKKDAIISLTSFTIILGSLIKSRITLTEG